MIEEHYRNTIQLFGLRISPFDLDRIELGSGRYTDSIVQPAWSYRSGGSYGLNSYSRPAVTLRHLENLMGEETFCPRHAAVLPDLAFPPPVDRGFQEDHPRGGGHRPQLVPRPGLPHRPRLSTTGYGRSARGRTRVAVGWFWGEDGQKTLLGIADRHESEVDPEEDTEAGDDSDGDAKDEIELYRSEIMVERRGEFVHPVTVELVFDDGEVLRHEWDGRSRWKKYVEIRPAKLVSAEVDPDNLMILDVDPLNNSRRLEADRRSAAKMITHLVFWLQNIFQLTVDGGVRNASLPWAVREGLPDRRPAQAVDPRALVGAPRPGPRPGGYGGVQPRAGVREVAVRRPCSSRRLVRGVDGVPVVASGLARSHHAPGCHDHARAEPVGSGGDFRGGCGDSCSSGRPTTPSCSASDRTSCAFFARRGIASGAIDGGRCGRLSMPDEGCVQAR